MMRRYIGPVLMAMITALLIAGCDTLRHATRSGSSTRESSAEDADTGKIQAVDSDPKNPQPFFKNNRLSGGWSSEAREIESHLGVGGL